MAIIKRNIIDKYSLDLSNGDITKKIKIGNKKETEMEVPIEERYLLHSLGRSLSYNATFYSQGCKVPCNTDKKIGSWKNLLSFWVYDRDGKLLIPFRYYDFDKNNLNQSEQKELLGELEKELLGELENRAVIMNNKFHISSMKGTKNFLDLEITRRFSAYHYTRGETCVCLIVPGEKPNENNNEIAAYGSELQENLLHITLNIDLRLKHLYIYGASGVGKELISTLVHYGIGRTGKLRKVDMTSPRKEVEERLVGSVTESGSFMPGFFEEAQHGTIIFDEMDKLKGEEKKKLPDLSYLLRPLDPGAYYPKNGREEKRTDTVTFVFVGTESPQELRTRVTPDDFFNRVSEPSVNLKHPLPSQDKIKKIHEEEKRSVYRKKYSETITYLIRYFYWKAVEEMAILEAGLEGYLKQDRLDLLLANELSKNEITTEERILRALVTRWLGNIKANDGFEIVNRIRYDLVDPIFSENNKKDVPPSIREIKGYVNDFIRQSWHTAESKKHDGELFIKDNNRVYCVEAALQIYLCSKLKMKIIMSERNPSEYCEINNLRCKNCPV